MSVGSNPSAPIKRIPGGVAQLVEQCPFKSMVQGSSPCTPRRVAEWFKAADCKSVYIFM